MGNLENIIYSPLLEEEQDSEQGWNKETVNYVITQRSKVMKMIRSVARGLRKNNLQVADVEDIYENILLYLHKSSDYDLNKAIERSSNGTIVSIDGYLNTCIKYCIMRFCGQLADYEEHIISDTITDGDDKELSIFNTIPDPNFSIDLDYLSYDLDGFCKSCESIRYKFGVDLYLVNYVTLLTLKYQIKDKAKDILNALDISKMDLSRFDRFSEDSAIVIMAKAITMIDINEALKILEKYVYSASLIKKIVLYYC